MKVVPIAFSLLLLFAAAPAGRQPVGHAPVLEYIAHAAFLVHSPGGTRIAIDPFNSERWLGYSFPDVDADAVLVTHPHYDHDAAYYFGPATPVFRRPGRFAVGDVVLEGHQGRHADPYGRDFGQINTVWVVDTGGVRIAHLGDNGPLTGDLVESLGRIDVLLVPVDGQEHILKNAEVAAIRARLSPRLTVGMHYRLPGFHDLPDSLDPFAPGNLPGAETLATNRLPLDAAALAARGRSLILQPSPAVRAWPDTLAAAWEARDAARDAVRSGVAATDADWNRAVAGLRKATMLAPGVIVFEYELAEALRQTSREAEAPGVLERALAAAERQDTEYAMRARALLADIYAAHGRVAEAAALYRIVAGSDRLAHQDAARAFFARHPAPR